MQRVLLLVSDLGHTWVAIALLGPSDVPVISGLRARVTPPELADRSESQWVAGNPDRSASRLSLRFDTFRQIPFRPRIRY
jgi:hypothetical protein